MRTPVFNRPKNDIRILRLATGYAVVTLYASYVETPKELLSTGGVHLTANAVEIKVPDMPDLEMDVIHRFAYYYDRAVREEIKWLTLQYSKVVNEIVAKLPPGKKQAVITKADEIIRQIAHGDKPFITQQEFAKILKYYI